MAIESGGGGKQDPHKDRVLGVSPVHQSLWETPVTEVVIGAFAGEKYQITRGDTTKPLLPALAEYLPGKIGKPQVKPDSVAVYEVRAKDAKTAIERTDPKHPYTRWAHRKDTKR